MNTVLLEKWQPILDSEKVAPISDTYRQKVTAQLLENQEKFLSEAANVTSDVSRWDPVLINLVRRMAPKLIAYDVCGVQPMTGPTGLIFAMRARYTSGAGTEAFVDEADTDHSGTGTHAAMNGTTDPWSTDPSTGTGLDAESTPVVPNYPGTPGTGGDSETNAWNAMAMTIEKTSVTAKTRQLRADYSLELAQDLRALHGLDAENELANILSTEIISEINREVVRKIYAGAVAGGTGGTGAIDLSADTDGRWFVENVKGLLFLIEKDANAIARATRRGKGNVIITTADIASALAMAGVLSYAPTLSDATDLVVDEAGVTYAGTLGRFKVFVDPYLTTDGYVVGYKGVNAYDAGMFYCPYVPLQMVRATDTTTFQPAIGFKTRYGIVANPFTTLASNVYYRKSSVANLI